MLIKYNEHLRQFFLNMFAEPRMTGGKRFNLERHIGALDPCPRGFNKFPLPNEGTQSFVLYESNWRVAGF